MAGIYGVLSTKKQDIEKIYTHFYSSSLDNTIKEEFEYKNFIYGRSVINKFLDDRVLFEDENVIIGFEGVFYNKITKKSHETILQWYQDKGIDFVQNIKGQFCGFVYDKSTDKLYIYTDHLSTKPLYIYKTDKLPNASIMSCSTFMKGGKPETDNWMYIKFDQIEEYVRPEMHDVLKKIGRLYEV